MTTVSTFVLEQFGDPVRFYLKSFKSILRSMVRNLELNTGIIFSPQELEAIGAVLKQVFLIFPHYCLGRGLMELVRLEVETLAFDKLGKQF
jgi:hypothetical protein